MNYECTMLFIASSVGRVAEWRVFVTWSLPGTLRRQWLLTGEHKSSSSSWSVCTGSAWSSKHYF